MKVIIFIRYNSPLGLLYRLDNCFSVIFFIYRNLHPDKVYSVKNNLKISSQLGELIFYFHFMRSYWSTVNQHCYHAEKQLSNSFKFLKNNIV